MKGSMKTKNFFDDKPRRVKQKRRLTGEPTIKVCEEMMRARWRARRQRDVDFWRNTLKCQIDPVFVFEYLNKEY